MKRCFLLIGVPCAGKTWVTRQLGSKFHHITHDSFIGQGSQNAVYTEAILEASKTAAKPLLAEAPFSISEIKEPLEKGGLVVTPIFIIESPEVITERYLKRNNKPIPKGHLSRLETYRCRAREMHAFQGTSDQVLAHLLSV